MNTRSTQPSRRHLARGLAAGLLLAQPAFAQTAPAGPKPPAGEVVLLEKFQVTAGFRGSLAAAAEIKENQVVIAEVIAAEDIGKLPDISIAESIARLPGLAAQRVAGRAQVISIRGLAPDFATTLLNGREQVSTGDNRGVEFDQYPSELMAGVTVYKTPDAGLVGQGLSGTLNLQTVKPLAHGRRTLALNGRYEVNTLDDLGSDSEHTGNRFSATYIDQFAGKTVGLALGFAHLESPVLAQEFGTYGWNTNSRPGVPAGTYATDGLKVFARSGTNTRDGLIGVLEWRPSTAFTAVFDAYWSKFSREETARGHETHIGGYNGGNNPGLGYTGTRIVNNTLVAGAASGVYPLVRNNYNDRTDKLAAFGGKGTYRNGKWTLTGDLSYSRAERDELNIETQAQYRSAAGAAVLDTATYDLSGGMPSARFGLAYTDPARIQVGPTIYGAGYGKVPSIEDEMTSAKVSASYAFGAVVDTVEFGFNLADRTKDKAQPEASLDIATFRPFAADVLLGATNLGFAGGPSTLSWDVPSALASAYAPFRPSSTAFGYLIQKTWRVDEEIGTWFLQGNLDSRLGDIPVRGNLGVQVKDVDQSSTSNYFDNAAPAGSQVKVNRDGKSYTNVLPSLNLVFDLGNRVVLRTAAAKQVARPRLDQLKSAFEFNIDSTTRLPSGSGGNPRLDPWKATALDLSLEKYFGDGKGYVSVAGFHKKLDTYIYEQTNAAYDFSRFTQGSPIPVTTTTGRYTQALNGQGGTLKGLEFTVSVPFSLFTPALDGFGVVASLAKNDSAITVGNTNLGSSIALPGLSRTVTNVTVYWEHKGFSARVSQRHRSDFIGEISGFGADRELRYVASEGVLDAQLGYEFREGRLKGFGVVLQAYNLGDSEYKTYQQSKDRVVEYQKYGRTFLAGVNWKF